MKRFAAVLLCLAFCLLSAGWLPPEKPVIPVGLPDFIIGHIGTGTAGTERTVQPLYRGYEACAEAIRKAGRHADVVLDLRDNARGQLHRIVFEAWEERPDVTVCILYRQEYKTLLLIAPGGADLSKIPGTDHSVQISAIASALGLQPVQVSDENLTEDIAAALAGLSGADTWTCPGCGRENDSAFCPDCGTGKPESRIWTCPGCGRENDSAFCPDCGAAKP